MEISKEAGGAKMSQPRGEKMKILDSLGIANNNQGASTGASWQSTGTEGTIEVISPVDGRLLASVYRCSEKDYRYCSAAAEETFRAWRCVPAPKRGEIVRQIGEALELHMGMNKEEARKRSAELLSMVALSCNSYTRLIPGFWAPTEASWGMDNRTCALRVIGGSAKAQRVEYRIAAAQERQPERVEAGCRGGAAFVAEFAVTAEHGDVEPRERRPVAGAPDDSGDVEDVSVRGGRLGVGDRDDA